MYVVKSEVNSKFFDSKVLREGGKIIIMDSKVNDSLSKVIGIDIGGTKIHLGLIQGNQIIQQFKIKTSALATQDQIIAEIISAIKRLIDDSVLGIGIGAPGLVNEDNGVIYQVQNIPSWQEVPLKQILEDYFSVPVYITNDANCFTLGEKLFGAAQPFKNVIGLSLGTGLGGGIIIDNKLYSGNFSSAGEFGGIPYLDKTFEDYCSGKFFREQFNLDGTEVYSLAENGDALGIEIYNQFGMHLGESIKMILFAFSPEAIILGGSITKAYPYFKDSMEKSVKEFTYKPVCDHLFVGPSTLDNAAVLGAAALCLHQLKHHELAHSQFVYKG